MWSTFQLRPRRVDIVRRAAVLMIVLAAGSCSRHERQPLRIAANPWPGFEYFFLAQELGYFDAEGVEVRLVEQTSLRDSRRAFVRGLVDGILATPTDVAALEIEGGRACVVQQVFHSSDGGDVIIARDPIKSMQDLRGKRIAIEQGLGTYFLSRALELSNMQAHEVEVVDRPYSTAAESLCNGSVDAIHAYPPSLELLAKLSDAQFHVVFTSKKMPDEILDLLVVDPKVAARRADDLNRVERAYDRALEFAAREPERAWRILADREGISPQAFANVVEHDIRRIAPADRAAYLAPKGQVAEAVRRSRDVLRAGRNSARRVSSRQPAEHEIDPSTPQKPADPPG